MDNALLKARLDTVRAELAAASDGRYPVPKLIAVTKTHPAEIILPLHEMGQIDIGENRVQEIVEKLPVIQEKFKIHLIGRLQSNKVKYIIEDVCLIHSLDRLSLAEEIDRQAQKHGKSMPVLVQVSPAGEPQKGGMPPEAKWLVFELAEAERLNAPKYSAWSLLAGRKRSRKLAGDVTNAQKGLYTLPVSPDDLKDGHLRLLTHNCKVTVPFVAVVAEPEQRLSFREEDGKWKFELRLAAPCEDVTCSLYGNDGHGPVPYPVGASGKNVAMKPDASRRLWMAEIPAQPIAAARNGKQMCPWAKATVLGGSLTVPAYTPLVSARPRSFD